MNLSCLRLKSGLIMWQDDYFNPVKLGLPTVWKHKSKRVQVKAILSLRLESHGPVNRNSRVMERGNPFNDVRCLFSDHYGGGVQVSAHHAGHNRGIHHPQPLQAVHTQSRVHHSPAVRGAAHLTRAGRVVGAVRLLSDESIDLCVGLDGGPRLHLGASERVEGFLSEDFPCELDALSELQHVSVCGTWGDGEHEKLHKNQSAQLWCQDQMFKLMTIQG